MINSDCQAFPLVGVDPGLTKREYFAGLAMQGLSAGDIENMYTCDDIAGIAVTQADALLKELEK